LGFGPIEPLMNDPEVSEIMVNGPGQIYIERKGKLQRVPNVFDDDSHVVRTIRRMLAPYGIRIDERSPIIDTRLPDGSILSVALPPVAINGPTLSIRKFRKEGLKIEDLIRFGSITREMAEFVDACVRARLNVIVSGGTGSGKTTILNLISGFIPSDERIITVEEFASLQLRAEHVVRLEVQPPDRNGIGGVSAQDLLQVAENMHPDRIIVGELYGSEMLDFLRMLGRGRDGCLTSIVADSPEQALDQIELLIKFNNPELPVSYLRAFIGATINLVVQINRLHDGSRKIVAITEVRPIREGYELRPVFRFRQTGLDQRGKIVGRLEPASTISSELAQRLLSLNSQLSPELIRLVQRRTATSTAAVRAAPGATTRAVWLRAGLERFAAFIAQRHR